MYITVNYANEYVCIFDTSRNIVSMHCKARKDRLWKERTIREWMGHCIIVVMNNITIYYMSI